MWFAIVLVLVVIIAYMFRAKWLPHVKNFMGSGSGEISQERLDKLENVLKDEEARTKTLADKAVLAEKIRQKAAAINLERTKQMQAKVRIQGRK